MGLKRTAAVVVTVSALLGGCGGVDGFDLNGRLFDMMGVSDAAQGANKREPRLEPRQGLVLPPTTTGALPSPGSGGGPEPTDMVRDHDHQKKLAAVERARLHKAYCSGEMNWKERATSAEARDSTPTSPYGPCTMFGEQLTDGANPKKNN